MAACCHTRSHSLLKTVLGKIGDQYQAYCTTYKTHAMATCHGGAGCPLDRGLDILTEDPEHTVTYNDSTHSLGGPETVGHPKDPSYNNQDRVKVLTREINDLHQRVAAGEGPPVETLDSIQCELQNLSIANCYPQPPAPAKPFGEVLCQYTDTLCFRQKQSNLTNALLQDIPVFNEHDSTKLEDWLIDIEMAADLTSEQSTAYEGKITRFDAHTSHGNDLFQ